jgi:diguanylate cyclase (GGDEF)-like protein
LEDLASRAALAIENARLRSEERQRMRALNALQTATAALLTTLDPEVMLAKILEAAQSAIPAAERGFLHLLEPSSGQLEMRAVSGTREGIRQADEVRRIRDYAAAAIREKHPLLIQDANEAGNSAASPAGGTGELMRSAIVAPLLLGAHVFGAIFLGASRPFAFTGADMSLLVSFAATATEALQNAMLYAEVQRLATTDTLTEQFNRRRFFELGYLEIERYHRFGYPLSLIMLDVDNLKEINDSHGHITGDQVLRTVARRIRQNIRQIDILGRYGGDEFAILLPSTDLHLAVEIADRIRRSVVEAVIETDAGAILASLSLGVAQVNSDSTTLSELLERADSALYIAKEKGRNRVEIG